MIDNEFFEEYKRLDRLCSDMYSCQNGVSEYITQMENRSDQGTYRVSSWNADYKSLKHIRWIRNQIAHDSATCQISEPEDLEFVQDFYERIFAGRDPLTLLRKAVEAEPAQRKQQGRQMTTASPSYVPEEEKSRRWIGALIGIVFLAFLLYYYVFSR